jgi:hypothetical protein
MNEKGGISFNVLTFIGLAIGGAITFTAAIAAIVIWSYTTFAPFSYVKEQNISIMTSIETRHGEAMAKIEQRYNDAKEHSDANFNRMMSVLEDIKEQVQTADKRIWQEAVPRKSTKVRGE